MMYVDRCDDTPVNLHYLVNLRRILPESFAHPFLHNALNSCTVENVPAHQVGSQPILATALAVRGLLKALTENFDTLCSELTWLWCYRGRRAPLLTHAPGGEFAVVSNWRSARLNELDFSGAMINTKSLDGIQRITQPTFIFFDMQEGKKYPARGSAWVTSECSEGIWVRAVLGARVWDRVRSSGQIQFV